MTDEITLNLLGHRSITTTGTGTWRHLFVLCKIRKIFPNPIELEPTPAGPFRIFTAKLYQLGN